ncbi:GntR family transcriptional regulator [Rhizobium terrae]|uniref:GntR family transcriptional regulator n=1 Tax=Rhizobium terrae TaxID=2171756 RepID=UPI000E3E1D92|nr:GntR family transcriptional regulator [Rhizobium terrae]
MKAVYRDLTSPDKTTEAYIRLKSAVTSYRSFPGAFFNIRSLADRMKLSPTPIREALIRLVHEEAIGFVPGRGYYVKPLDLDDLRADYELTFLLLRFAIEKSVKRFNPEHLPPIPQPDDRLEEAGLADGCALYIEAFYEEVALLAGNPRLAQAIRQFNDRTRPLQLFALRSIPRPGDRLLDFTQLAAVLASGGRKQAIRMLKLRCQEMTAELPDLVKSLHSRAQHVRMPLEDLV